MQLACTCCGIIGADLLADGGQCGAATGQCCSAMHCSTLQTHFAIAAEWWPWANGMLRREGWKRGELHACHRCDTREVSWQDAGLRSDQKRVQRPMRGN